MTEPKRSVPILLAKSCSLGLFLLNLLHSSIQGQTCIQVKPSCLLLFLHFIPLWLSPED
jgi:hypothetical protein